MEKDTERLNFLIDYQVFLAPSRDHENYTCWYRWNVDADGDDGKSVPVEGYPLKFYNCPREAIDAAIRYINT